VPLVTPSRRVFRAIGDALGILTGDAVTEFDVGPVLPRLDVQPSLEAAVNYSDFVLLRTDIAGGANTTVDVDVHVLTDWTGIRHRNRTLVNIPGSEVPAGHDAWIIRAGVSSTTGLITRCSLFWETATLGAGGGHVPLFYGDARLSNSALVRGPNLDSPLLLPLPWWVPPVAQLTAHLRFELVTTGVISTNLVLGVLSAPPGTFRRLY